MSIRILCDALPKLPLTSFIFYEANPKKHDAMKVDALCASFKEFGVTTGILVDEKNVIVAGHARYLAAKQLDMKEFPYICATGWNESQIKAYRLLDNHITTYHSFLDESLIKLELDAIQLADLSIDLGDIGFTEDYIKSLSFLDADIDTSAVDDIEENLDGIVSVVKVSCDQTHKEDLKSALKQFVQTLPFKVEIA